MRCVTPSVVSDALLRYLCSVMRYVMPSLLSAMLRHL